MQVLTESLDTEVRVTVDAGVELANAQRLGTDDTNLSDEVRSILIDHEFVRASSADESDLEAIIAGFEPLSRLIAALPDTEVPDAVAAVNDELGRHHLRPTVVAHDGAPLHIHWTAATEPFAEQVVVDVLMALAQTLCEHGTTRFGRCAAEDCERVFYDTTRNRSRRFCSDPRCASRTHTASHRARRKRT